MLLSVIDSYCVGVITFPDISNSAIIIVVIIIIISNSQGTVVTLSKSS